MAGNRFVCESCGDALLFPRHAPEGSYEMTMQGLRAYLKSDQIELQGRDFTERELADLTTLTTSCECGGRRIEDLDDGTIRRRCPECRSEDLRLELCADID